MFENLNKKIFIFFILICSLIFVAILIFWPSSSKEKNYIFVKSWGAQGEAHGQFNDPTGIEIYKNQVFVSDSRNSRIQVFDLGGDYIRQIVSQQHLKRPMQLMIYDDKIFVADYVVDKIIVFNLDGTFVKEIGESGSGPGEFNGPAGMAVSADNKLYVADFYNHRVQILSLNGGYIGQLGVTNEAGVLSQYFRYPTDVKIDTDGNIYIADGYNDRIKVYTPNNQYSHMWGGPLAMNISGPFNGWFATVSSIDIIKSSNSIISADFYNNRIQKFTKDGVFLSDFGREGSKDGELTHPFGVAVSDDGMIFLTDLSNNRVQKWQPAP
jgi:6-bladed beta-propeller protein/NHL repeat-containing protein